MAGAPEQKFGTSTLVMDPSQKKGLLDAGQQYQQQVGTYQSNIQDLQKNAFNPNLDAFSHGLLSLAKQNTQNQVGAQQAQIQQQFKNPGTAGVLQQQLANQQVLQNNGLPFQAGLAQRSREGSELATQSQLMAAPMAAQQNLLSVLSSLAAMTGKQVTRQTNAGDDPNTPQMQGLISFLSGGAFKG